MTEWKRHTSWTDEKIAVCLKLTRVLADENLHTSEALAMMKKELTKTYKRIFTTEV